MEFRILGPIEVVSERGTLTLGGRIQRALLANLLLHANHIVSADRLMEDLWGDDPPLSAPHMLHVYVSRLRKELAGPGEDRDILVTRPPGYLVRVEPPDRLDLDRFEDNRRTGRRALEAGDPYAAASALHEALDLWRGPALSGFEHEAFAQPQIARLDELRLVTLEDRIEADLGLGRNADVVAELRTLTASHPLRERLWMLLALGLYRSGRQGDALSALQTARQMLADELGVDPGPALVDLETKILRQDPAVEWSPPAASARPAGTPRPPSRIRMGLRPQRRNLLLSIVTALALIAAVILIPRGGRSEFPRGSPNSIAVIDASTDHLLDGRWVGREPGPITYDPSSGVWLLNTGDNTVGRVSPEGMIVRPPIGIGQPLTAIAAGLGKVWVAVESMDTVTVIDPRTNRPSSHIDVDTPSGIAVGNALWVSSAAGALYKIDPNTLLIEDTVPLGPSARGAGGVATGLGGVWVAAGESASIEEIDPSSDRVMTRVSLSCRPTRLAIGAGSVWATCEADSLVERIDPLTRTATSIRVGAGPLGIAVTPDAVWVACSQSGQVTKIDPTTARVVDRISLHGSPRDLIAILGTIWVTVAD